MTVPTHPREGSMRALPTLVDLAAHPDRVAELAPETARALLAQLASLQGPLLAQAMAAVPADRDPAASLLLVPQAAQRLGIESSYLYDLIRQGRVPAVRLGAKYVRVHPDVVAEIQRTGLDTAYPIRIVRPVTGKQLRALRGDQTQAAFAERLGVHANTLARYERDELAIPEPVARLAAILMSKRPTRRRD